MSGNYQSLGHTDLMLHHYVYGMNPREAIDFPRAFNNLDVVGIVERLATPSLMA